MKIKMLKIINNAGEVLPADCEIEITEGQALTWIYAGIAISAEPVIESAGDANEPKRRGTKKSNTDN